MRTNTATVLAFPICESIHTVQEYLVNLRDFLRCKENAIINNARTVWKESCSTARKSL